MRYSLLELQDMVQRRMSDILASASTPQIVMESLLSLVEFMHRGNITRLSPQVLASAKISLSQDSNRLDEPCDPLLLWYAEIDCESLDNEQASLAKLIEANIRVGIASNNKQDDAALSSIKLAEAEFGMQPKSQWLQALSRWDEALQACERETRTQVQQRPSFQSLSTQMICHYALADFEQVYDLSQKHHDSFTNPQKRDVAHWATVSAWAMGDFENMAKYVTYHKKGSTKLLYK